MEIYRLVDLIALRRVSCSLLVYRLVDLIDCLATNELQFAGQARVSFT